MTKILVTGANGQLAQCIAAQIKPIGDLHVYIVFKTSQELDITSVAQLTTVFKTNDFDYCINCAAYTNVEQAEKTPDKAFLVNAEGVRNIAAACKSNAVILVHISTDYVFDGQKTTPYTEEDKTNPINVYGTSKLAGEQYIQELLDSYFIIRTSWLYSEYGKNFYKTISEKSETATDFTITTAEQGTPTNANDLARYILHLIAIASQQYGIYHYSNLGEATWHDFAKEIIVLKGKQDHIALKKTDNYPTFAKRPKYSVLSKEKNKRSFNHDIPFWEISLKKLMRA